ncbi:MAG TPA: nucleotide pyrophosphohydrolase [Acidilobales archaeon]|nr:nucleotide pyrophosphohydrolase [Acidilobales archaeon]
MRISEFQKVIKDLYYEKDHSRGLERTFMWFIEEVGELAEALRKGDRESLGEEMADVLAWLTSLANLVNVDLELEAKKKYGRGFCPRCGMKKCICKE